MDREKEGWLGGQRHGKRKRGTMSWTEMRSWIEGREREGWRAKQRDQSRRKQKRDVEVDKGMKRGKEGKVTEQINRVPDRMTGRERRMENLTEGQREQWGWGSAEMARKTKRGTGSK